MDFNDWGALIAICVAGAISPGPSLIVIISISSKFGRKAGFLSAAGHGLAVFIYAITTAVSISFLSDVTNSFFFLCKISRSIITSLDGSIDDDFCK